MHHATFKKDWPLEVALYGMRDPTSRAVHACFLLASLAHLWLADAWQWSWFIPNLLALAGLGLIAWRGAALGWALAALGALLPLFVGQDQLTQSVLLFAFAAAGACFNAAAGLRALRHPALDEDLSPEDLTARDAPYAAGWMRWCQGVTLLGYALAAFHKTNSDFLDPMWSCAVYGAHKLEAYWHLPPMPDAWLAWTPWVTLATESSVVMLHLVGRRRMAWTLAVAFHIPLTLTMAPAFAFVMMIGHAAFLTPDDLNAMAAAWRRHGLALGGAGALATGLSLWAHQSWPVESMIVREWMLWTLLFALPVALPLWRADTPRAGVRAWGWRGIAAGWVALVLHGMTPYTGLQFHHTAAMLSNLRVDPGCWNSLIMPEELRVLDDYVRIDDASLIEPGAIPYYEDYFKDHLWSPRLLRYVRGNWCKPSVRPIHLKGTWRGEAFEIEDLCAPEPLPIGAESLDGVARFQKFLTRRCPQACIH